MINEHTIMVDIISLIVAYVVGIIVGIRIIKKK